MYKTKEEIEKEFYERFCFIQAIKNEKSGNSYTRISDFIHQIRQDDLNAIKEMIIGKMISLPNEEPYVPFYKPYGMSDEEYTSEIGEANQRLGEYQAIEEHNKIFEDILEKLNNLKK